MPFKARGAFGRKSHVFFPKAPKRVSGTWNFWANYHMPETFGQIIILRAAPTTSLDLEGLRALEPECSCRGLNIKTTPSGSCKTILLEGAGDLVSRF